MKRLSAALFTWENYGLNNGENGWSLLGKTYPNIPCDGYSVVGYTNGAGLLIRPKDGNAVMFLREEDGLQFWLHVGEFEFEALDAKQGQEE